MKKITFFILLLFSFYLFSFERNSIQFTGESVEINSKIFFPFKIKGVKSSFYAGTKLYLHSNDDITIDEIISYSEKIGCTFIKKIKRTNNTFLLECRDNVVSSYNITKKVSEVFSIEPDTLIKINMKNYKDPYLSNEWHMSEDGVSVFSTWKLLENYGIKPGQGIKIAIIDDGFELYHEDLNDAFIKGYDFVDNDNLPSAYSYNNHGTAVTGIIAAQVNGKGCVGVAPYSKIVPIKIVSDTVMSSDVVDVFNYALDQGVDIISNSWGPADGGGAAYIPDALNQIMADAVVNGRDGKGTVIVFAAGNGNESISDESSYDGFAANENVISVGAVSRVGRRAYYSDFGKDLDFMAPSCDLKSDDFYADWITTSYDDGIWTTDLNDSLGYTATSYSSSFCGTSASAPILSGVVALMLSANKDLTFNEIYELFQNTAEKVDIENGAYDENGESLYYGYGRINAYRALSELIENYGIDESEIIDEDGYTVPDEDVFTDRDNDISGSLINIEKEGCACSFII